MKKETEKKMVEIDAHELVMMKAEEAQMKLSMQNMADLLDDAKEELRVAKEELGVVSKELRDTRLLLHSAVQLQEKAETTAERCEQVLRGFLSRWLSKENAGCVRTMLRFYHPLDRMKTWVFKLDARFGELPFWGLVRKLYDWTKDRMADCAEDDSEANELMLKRVPYHAINYAAPFIDMRHWENVHQQGSIWTGQYETDETDWKLCELIARIQYATQQHFFGVMAEKYFDD